MKGFTMKRLTVLLLAVCMAALCFAESKPAKKIEQKPSQIARESWLIPAEIPQEDGEQAELNMTEGEEASDEASEDVSEDIIEEAASEKVTFETFFHSRKAVEAKANRMYGDVDVTAVTKVYKDYIFHCNIDTWPAIIGENVPVRISGVTYRSTKPVNKSDEDVRREVGDFITAVLQKAITAKTLKLRNIKRGKSFCLIASVSIDGEDLGKMLIEKGFAKLAMYGEVDGSLTTDRNGSRTAVSAQMGIDLAGMQYLGSKSSKVFHKPDCRFARVISWKNVVKFKTLDDAVNEGRRPCKSCGL
jgi:endonuclease YncB( thermonuclease family)